jgi:23S rRNA (uracil1939-C5)-methyltransferase
MEKPPKKGDEIKLEVGKLAFGGKGVARVDGYVIFIEGALPGDTVRAAITRAKPSWADARVLEVLSPSATRISPPCRHFRYCGGCSWQTLTYAEQLKFKQQQVVECLEHIGGLSDFNVDKPIGAEPLWRYRNKVEFSFAGGRNGIELGFHPPGEWREVIDIEDCLLHSERTNQVRNFIRDFTRGSGADAYDQGSRRGFWRHLVIREGLDAGEIMVNIVTADGEFPGMEELKQALAERFPDVASLVWSVNRGRAAVAGGLPFTVLAGRDHIFEEICGIRLKLSPSSFLQTNTLMAERLYRRALEYAGLTGSEQVLDLYSGIGSIGLLLAGNCRYVEGIEIMEEAVLLARENARLNGISNCGFTAGKVRTALKEVNMAGPPDLVVLDPPRAGASKKEVGRILMLEPRRIVYVSCNASTMAGNARQFQEGGYQLKKVGAVDMFPHTPHIESVSLFEQS